MSVPIIKNEVGEKYGRLTVLEYAGMNDRHNALFLCQCECGGQKIATGSGLRNGTIKSCGCLRKEKAFKT